MSPVLRGTHRPVCNWGSGDLPAPYAEGDLVRLVHPGDDEWHKRMREVPVIPGAIYVVTTAFSIDEGDAWYFRVAEHTRGRAPSSDRLHVAYPGRFDPAGFGEGFIGCDWMAPFGLVKTVDPEGLERRTQLLADGWSFSPPERCPTCRRPMHDARGRPMCRACDSGRYFCEPDHCQGRTEAVCCDDEGECVGWCLRLHADHGVQITPPTSTRSEP